MPRFITENFLLESKSAQRLYHEYAKEMPIFDYHCHLSPKEIADDRRFENITQIWLQGDHYKWRAMRAAGIDEFFITGKASDREKFDAWARVCPKTVRNPLFHWTMLELNRPFGIHDSFLDESTASDIWERCNEKLQSPEFSVRGILRQMNVYAIGTTDDPVDSLDDHRRIMNETNKINEISKTDKTNRSKDTNNIENAEAANRSIGQTAIFDRPMPMVRPAFRPDKVLPGLWNLSNQEERSLYLAYLSRLGKASGREIRTFADVRDALLQRHAFFHQAGCRLSDHGFGLFDWSFEKSEAQVEAAFQRLLRHESVSSEEAREMSSRLLLDLGRANADKNWVMQLHLGALRNNSTRIFRQCGPDAGCDSMIDGDFARPLARFLDRLDQTAQLPKTIVYNLNPSANALLASLIANFNDGSFPGKMQYGSGWWFLDQKNGMEEQLQTLSNMGLLSYFVGMLTDSRSFLSYTRHEYFRRILCNVLGHEMEMGLLPNDFNWIGGIIRDIAFNNAVGYFQWS